MCVVRCSKFHVMRLRRHALKLSACLSVLGSGAVAHADEIPSAVAAPYSDKLMAGGALDPLILGKNDQSSSTDQGNLRSLVAEISRSRIVPRATVNGAAITEDAARADEIGVALSGRYQTDNFGTLTIDTQLQKAIRYVSATVGNRVLWTGTGTIGSRGVPLGNGWVADTKAGTFTIPFATLQTQRSRIYLPSTALGGASIVFRHFGQSTPRDTGREPQPKATFNLSIGEPGLFGGIRVSDFTGLEGTALSFGGDLRLSSRIRLAAEAIAMNNTIDPYISNISSLSLDTIAQRLSSQAVTGNLSYDGARFKVQGGGLMSQSSLASEAAGSATRRRSIGGWLDGSMRDGATQHSAGLYYLQPDLLWGNALVVNDTFGGYYRLATSSQRWRWALDLDGAQSITGRGASGALVNADMRRQLTFTSSAGLNATLRQVNGMRSMQSVAFFEFSNILGSSRVEAGWAADRDNALYRVGWNQVWALPTTFATDSRLTTVVSYSHRIQYDDVSEQPTSRANTLGLAVTASLSPLKDLSLDATASYNSDATASALGAYGPVQATTASLDSVTLQSGRTLAATVSATARLSSRLSLAASYTDIGSNSATRYSALAVSPSPLGLTQQQLTDLQTSTYRMRAGYLTLRYALTKGRTKVALGAREYPVGGTGSLEGRVYLDANADHRPEPAEVGVRGIVVILDGVLATTTDSNGMYRFWDVADGTHRVTLDTDALPLPWNINGTDAGNTSAPFAATVSIGVRKTSRLDIAASRE
jgi:hypothetical protein